MQLKKMLQIVDVHCEGEIGNVVTGGIVDIPGKTMAEKLAYFDEDPAGQRLLRFICHEPRGSMSASVNVITPPVHPDADVGFVVLQPGGPSAMSGSNSICVTTALLETGIVPMSEPETVMTLDTASGLVKAVSYCDNGKCRNVALDMMPSFVEALDFEFQYRGARCRADIAFGGVYFAIVDVDQLGLTIDPEHNNALAHAGLELCALINGIFTVQHPLRRQQNRISYVMFRQFDGDVIRTCTILKPGRCDRSPCGTGSSANLAVLYERGLAQPGQDFISQSIIGSQFKVHLSGISDVAGKVAVLPRITGRAWLYGMHQIALDSSDPFPEGYMLG